MSRLLTVGKKILERNSRAVSFLRFIPYSFRLGRTYNQHARLIDWYLHASLDSKRQFHFAKLRNTLDHAYHKVPFYEEFYSSLNYHPRNFKCLADFGDVPIITKADLKKYELTDRSLELPGSTISNTGGTSGSPLEFRLDSKVFAREWAYMHRIWGRLGYNYLDTKLTFRGTNIGDTPILYNVVHNEFIVNSYVGFDRIVEEVIRLSKRKSIRYLHGYPSAIYEFCKYLEANNLSVKDIFQGQLQGVFFGSEYPAPLYRDLIEKVLRVPTLSWYGHSEFAILAEEKNPYQYSPFPTYGYAEALKRSNDDDFSLLATGYYNKAAPFIRYDTGDLVKSPCWDEGVLSSFEISSGRVGDFIVDVNEKKISLTALIFGRHHNAFGKAEFIQVKSISNGKATLVVTAKEHVSIDDFDLSNVAIDFELKIVEKPVRTKNGKLPLLII